MRKIAGRPLDFMRFLVFVICEISEMLRMKIVVASNKIDFMNLFHSDVSIEMSNLF